MNDNLLRILEEQSAFSFTGRVNILKKTTKQYLGSVFQVDGTIVFSKYEGRLGINALVGCLIDVNEGIEHSYVIEPELIEDKDTDFRMSILEVKAYAAKEIHEYQLAKKLNPPRHLSLSVNPEFVKKGQNLSQDEFSLLKLVFEYPRVEDIFKFSKFLNYEVIKLLVSLRAKKAITVKN